MNNKAEIAKMVGTLAVAFSHAKVTDTTIEVYVRLLGDISVEVLTTAIEQCVTECKFFPTIAEIRDKVLALTAPQRRDPMDAWGEVLQSIARVGFYNSPSFDDPLIARAVDSLGWKYLCSSENIVADRAHFSKLYEQLVQREAQDRRLLPAARQLRQISRGSVLEIGDGNGH